jgi:hypothetical protein
MRSGDEMPWIKTFLGNSNTGCPPPLEKNPEARNAVTHTGGSVTMYQLTNLTKLGPSSEAAS